MPDYPVGVPPDALVRWIKAEAEGDFVNFHVNAAKSYVDSRDGRRIPVGTLSVEPLVERNYWILRIQVRGRPGAEDGDVAGGPPEEPLMRFEEFEAEFLSGDRPEAAGVTVTAQTPEAKAQFESWLDELRARHGSR